MSLLDSINKLETNWKDCLCDPEIIPTLNEIDSFITNERKMFKDTNLGIFPPQELIFNAFNHFNIEDLKVVILGQDCYHQKGQATGLSFSVPKNVKVPPSLINIFKEISNDTGSPVPSHGDLTSWAKQGVLLLNSSLTVLESSPMSHMRHWKPYTDYIIKYISYNCPNVIFVFWGKVSQLKIKLIPEEIRSRHYILTSNHPSPLSANRGGWFGCRHFSKINNILKNELNATEIQWLNT